MNAGCCQKSHTTFTLMKQSGSRIANIWGSTNNRCTLHNN